MEENEKIEQNPQEEKVKNKKNQAMDVAALTLGIISILTSGMWLVAIPASILAIVFGVKSARRTGSKIAKAGMITGIIGICINIVLLVGTIVLIEIISSY